MNFDGETESTQKPLSMAKPERGILTEKKTRIVYEMRKRGGDTRAN